MGLFVDTVSAAVPLKELGITINHPSTNFDLSSFFSADDIRDAESLTAAITGGDLLWKKTSGGAVEPAGEYDPDIVDIDNENLGPGKPGDRAVTFKDISTIGNAPMLLVGVSTEENFPGAAWADVEFDQVAVETHPTILRRHATLTNRIEILEDGHYLLNFSLNVHFHDLGENVFDAHARILKNGTTEIPLSPKHNIDGWATEQSLSNTVPAVLSAGDYITLQLQGNANNESHLLNFCAVRPEGIRGEAGPTGAGSNIIVQKDDVAVGTVTDTLNLEGDGIKSAVDEGSNKTTVTIPGGWKLDRVITDTARNDGTSYAVKKRFRYLGTNNDHTITAILLVAKMNSSSVLGSVKVFDVTNGLTIAETTFTNIAFELLDMGAISNLPTGLAMFEVQIKSGADTYNVTVDEMCLRK